jgi:hypothetical protein
MLIPPAHGPVTADYSHAEMVFALNSRLRFANAIGGERISLPVWFAGDERV